MFEFLLSSLKTLCIIALFQAFLIAVFLLIQKKGNRSNRIILAIILINFIIFLTGTYILRFEFHWGHAYYAHLANLTVFLAPPLLYLYYQSLLDSNFKFKFRYFYHCLPFLTIFLYMFYIIVFRYNYSFVFTSYGITLLTLLFIQSIVYLWLIIMRKNGLLFKHIKSSKSRWFGYTFAAILLMFCIKLIIFITWNLLDLQDICVFFTGLFFIVSFFIINMMVLFGLYNPEMLVQYFKYQNSIVDDSFKLKCFQDIQNIFGTSKIYTDPLLSLDRLSRKLTISEKQLSQIINECAGQNFNDFINQYRISEAKDLIRRAKSKNILMIAYDSGFNSKSTFNTAFKKFTNMTPSEYKQMIV